MTGDALANLPPADFEAPGVKLYCADAVEFLPGIRGTGIFDACVTDPPYGINTKSDGSRKISPWGDLCNASLWYSAWLRESRRLAGVTWAFLNWRSMVTYQKAACDLGWPIESMLVWDKKQIGPGGTNGLRPCYELVALWCSGGRVTDRGAADVQRFPWATGGGDRSGHPAEKPVDLIAWLIRLTGAQCVLDPFMGSGTTGVAAVRAGLEFVGVEISRDYVDLAARRIEAELAQGKLFK